MNQSTSKVTMKELFYSWMFFAILFCAGSLATFGLLGGTVGVACSSIGHPEWAADLAGKSAMVSCFVVYPAASLIAYFISTGVLLTRNRACASTSGATK